ncbi:MAG: SBBP repeat-containing protein [Pirellulales bacterium]|nr:SBBP repeat-containing protein [Pirellulales bacterium]
MFAIPARFRNFLRWQGSDHGRTRRIERLGFRRPRLECLEQRQLLAVSASDPFGSAEVSALLGSSGSPADGQALAMSAAEVTAAQTPDFGFALRLGSTGLDAARSVAIDDLGNLYVLGLFEGSVDFDPGAGTAIRTGNAFVAKYSPQGAFFWAQAFTGSFISDVGALAIDVNGNVFVAGSFSGTVDFDPGPGSAPLTSTGWGGDAFVLKLNPSGNYLWARSLGGNDYDAATALDTDDAGNVYATGHFWGTVDVNPGTGSDLRTSAGERDVFVWKLSGTGNLVWARTVGGTGDDHGRGITLDDLDNVHITGTFFDTVDFNPGAGTALLTSAGWDDVFVLKLNNSGNYLWAKRFGGGPTEVSSGIVVDPDGNVYTAGYFWGEGDFDPGPGITMLSSAGEEDIFVSKLDASGNFGWARRMGGPLNDGAMGIELVTDSQISTVGYFQGTADFDPGSAVVNLTSAGQDDVFVSSLDTAGGFVWAGAMGGSGSELGLGIVADDSGNLVTTGYFEGTADFNPGSVLYPLTSSGGLDVFLSKLTSLPPGTGAIGDRVWDDVNENGVLDAGEPGVSGVRVELFHAGANGQIGGGDDQSLGTVSTNDAGEYSFLHLPAGQYYLHFSNLPSGRSFTTKDVGNDNADSDVDPSTGMTDVFLLADAASDGTRDAGLVAQAAPSVSIVPGFLGLALVDTDGSAFRMDVGESGLELSWLGDIADVDPLDDIAGSAALGSRFFGISDGSGLDPSLRSVLGYADVDISAPAPGGSIAVNIVGAVFTGSGLSLTPVDLAAMEFGADQTTLFAAGTAGGSAYLFELDYQNPQDYGLSINVVLATPVVNLGSYRPAGDLAFALDNELVPDANNLYLTTDGSNGQALSLLATQPAAGTMAAVPGLNLGASDFEGLSPWFGPDSLVGFRSGTNEAVRIDLGGSGSPTLESLGSLSETHLGNISGASALWMMPEDLGPVASTHQNDAPAFGQYWYAFTAAATGAFRAVLNSGGSGLTLYAYDNVGQLQSLVGGGTEITYEPVYAGQELYLHVGGLWGNADLDLEILGPATELNVVDYWKSGVVATDNGHLAYQFEAARNGVLTAEVRQGASGGTEMRLYALGPTGAVLQPPLETGLDRIDFEPAAAGGRYLLTVAGLAASAEVCLANLVERTGSHVSVYGTSGGDSFAFDASAGNQFTIKDVVYAFTPVEADSFSFDGLDGNDSVAFVGTSGPDNATVHPTSGNFSGTGYDLDVVHIESTNYDGAGGEDTVYVWGSTAANTYTGHPGRAEMTGGGVSITVMADRIYGRGGGGADTATIWDSDGNDVFEFFPVWAKATGDGLFHHVQGFTTIIGKAELGANGTDEVFFRGSAQGDWLKSTTITTRMLTLGAWRNAEGFDTITAYGRGAKDKPDTLLVQDTPGADTLKLKPLETTLATPTYKVTAYGFGSVDATRVNVNAADDKVTLEDSAGDDTFTGNPAWIQIASANPAYTNKATGFPSVMGYSTGAGMDRAYFSDFNGAADARVENDTFTAGSLTGELTGPGYRLWARFFDEVHAEAKLGRDIANLSGTTGVDQLDATATEVGMWGANAKGTFANYAKYFDEVYAAAGNGLDKAIVHGATIESDYQPPAGIPLDQLSQALWLNQFEKIEHWQSPTAMTEINDVSAVFAYWD